MKSSTVFAAALIAGLSAGTTLANDQATDTKTTTKTKTTKKMTKATGEKHSCGGKEGCHAKGEHTETHTEETTTKTE